MSKVDDQLLQIKNEILALKKSPLYDYRVQNNNFPVIGEGLHTAKIMLIGEAPGKNEAATGRPFCGTSGKFLTQLIEGIGLSRADVYITNLVKDRPPDNRDPSPDEISLYAPFLDRQIEVIKPKVIATLGRYSMAYILQKFSLVNELQPISKIHGKVFKSQEVTIIPLYHPAVALYNGSMREKLHNDFAVLKNYT